MILQPVLNAAFPIPWSEPGKKITISDPDLRSTTCAPLRMEVRAHIHYRDTRGFDQGSASGQVRFAASATTTLSYTGSLPIHSSNFVDASACINDINILDLNIHNVPNWLDNTWIRKMLKDKLAGKQVCRNIKPYVAAYLATGKTLP